MVLKHEERIGSTVARRWTLERLVGSGSTSAVYEGKDADGVRRAIKILHPALCGDEVVVQRFLREAYIPSDVSHPAMVHVHADGISDGLVFLVLDLLEGETLEERRLSAGGKLALDVVGPIAMELMRALAAVHRVGVVHRDLKPGNIFITAGGELKLLDFGIARVPPRTSRQLSVEGLVIGTPGYMSPEQARGVRDGIDVQSDVWSVGATLFTALSGEYVHVARDAHQRLLAAASRAARPLFSAAPEVPAPVAAVVDRALSYEKKDRWTDMDAMRTAFAESLGTVLR